MSAARSWSLLLLLGVAACTGAADHGVHARGTVEVDEIALAPLATARVVSVRIEEGDAVAPGDTVAVLSQATLPSAAAAEAARLAAAEATLRDLRAGARTPEIRAAQAELAAADAEADRTRREQQRVEALLAAGAASRRERDAAAAAAVVAQGRRDAAAAALRLLQDGARTEQLRAAAAEVERARAGLAGVAASADELVLVSPAAGTVLGRHADPGEVLAAGIPAATIGVTARPWIRAFLSARALAGVRLGQSATVTLAGAPDRRFAGRVVSIGAEAEFTPRVALTEEERADLLFPVRILVADTTGAVRPGLPATVLIDTMP